jgi:uncharacterized protein
VARETVLVTGASAGIGRAIAREFAATGAGLVLVARREAELRVLAEELTGAYGTPCLVLPLDLTMRGAGAELIARLASAGVAVDVAVLNAGFGLHGPLLGQDPERLVDMVQLNAASLTDLARRLAPAMVERRRGGLLLVGSLAGFQPMPGFAVYAATKAYVLSFGEAIASELAPHGVRVSVFCPGPVPTEFRTVAGSPKRRASFLDTPTVDEAARAAVRGFRAGHVVVVQPRFRGFFSASLGRFLPRSWIRALAARFA